MILRRGWPLAILLVLLVVVPSFEIWLIVEVGRSIGVLPTVALLVAEALLGGWLIRREGSRTWAAVTEALRTSRVPSGELADAALVLVGGVLLMLPGFLTDLIGFFFLLPLTRPLARRILGFFVARRIHRMGTGAQRGPGGMVIEGETVPEAPGAGRRPEGPTIITGQIDDGR
ncbi:MAG: Cytoplasmic rane protein FsxA [Friedmanniella sp.]|jgi:UPF0716 protein FxsA|nr:Cytoplasmic rane protein FsxA [Friedmanniella sp.]